ncbi:hypothetical protein ACJ72_00364 [Emergomyces africanus]|uniref:Mid2 domain-containing protein n=1 Tax=Emergomyces africanus TaxID=1955775 RepID=A0A1B7P881_9EURO|nr:hypothetical protein ACJ72_00364 [Emergomyces africanus]
MRHPTPYFLVISSWACLFALSWASPVDLSSVKFRPCPSPLIWDVEDVAGSSGKCVSRPTQQIGMFKMPNIESQRWQLIDRKPPSQNNQKGRTSIGSNRRNRRIIEEDPTRERDPFTFPPEPIPTFFPGDPGPPHFITATTEDLFEEPFPGFPTTSTIIVSSDAPQTPAQTTSSTTPQATFTQRTPIVLSTSSPTPTLANSINSKTDSGPIIAGCSIGGIALIAILYLAFLAWRRSRNKKRRDELSVAPPPYTRPPMGGPAGPQTRFTLREATREISSSSQLPASSRGHGSNLAYLPDNASGQLQGQERRISGRFYAAVSPVDTDSNYSNGLATSPSNPSNTQNRGVGTYSQTSNYPEPFTNLPIVTEESHQGHLPPVAPVSPHESATVARAATQPTSYRSRRDSRDIVRRSVFGSISSNSSNNSHEHGSTDYDWQHVSYPNPNPPDFARHLDVSPIEPTDIDRLPFGRERSPPLPIDTPQRQASNIRPNSTVTVNSLENMNDPPSIVTGTPR